MELIDLTNKRFTHWTVIGPHQTRQSKKGRYRTFWFCQCECGKRRWVNADNLKRGISTNCGCLKPRHTEAQNRAYKKFSKSTLTHGMTGQRLYRVWQRMIARCDNPNDAAYMNYGGRGITVCDEWRSFEVFRDWSLANGYTKQMTIERNNVDGNYEPANCRYIPLGEQARNTRRTIWIKDQTHLISLPAYCEKYAVPYIWVWTAIKLKIQYPEVWNRLQDPLT